MLRTSIVLIGAVFLFAASPIPSGPPNGASSDQTSTVHKDVTSATHFGIRAASSGGSRKSADAPPEWSLSDKIAVIASTMAFLQFVALVGTIVMMDRSDRRQLRAYVNVRGAAATPKEVMLTVKNFGQSPAHKVSFWVEAELHDKSSVPTFEKLAGKTDSAETVVAPTAKFIIRENVKDMRKNTQVRGVIYTFGGISYLDIFGGPKRTTSFRYFRPEDGTPGALMVHDNGNDAT